MVNKKIKVSKKPYILEITEIKKNKNFMKNSERLKFSKEFSPLSGSELEYNPHLWNDNNKIKTTHNCYTYALGKIVPGLKSKAQPGYASGF